MDMAEFVAKCPNRQQVKSEHQKSGGLLQNIQIPTWDWEDIYGLCSKFTSDSKVIWFHISGCGLIDYVRSLYYRHTAYSAEDYARIFLDKIFFNHGIPLSIILNRVAQFTLRFWRSFKKGLGTMVKLSTAFHPHMDGQAERDTNPWRYVYGVHHWF